MRRDAAIAPAAEVGSAEAVVIDVDRAPAAATVDVDASAHGVACRICHLSPEGGDEPAAAAAGGSEVIRLGCGCKEELGAAHRQCAEAWFRIKGDRRCEICGSDAKNITGLEVKKFMEEWHGRRMANTTTTVERESTCWRRQPFCKHGLFDRVLLIHELLHESCWYTYLIRIITFRSCRSV
ncbi:uncharacterized protein LOC100837984 isoform X1 [Brachypodium distachyon]|uniref:RING-CH-type domain-containing protein n=1 Tax=Brachypodium distachyon TaxID=15368 RepID=A0A2K2DER0_BRADI|nr:uncharacterized protein LOC100837984 isoform X1 [Brachypodium distachyon]PNT72772.1 hypothetical protein BRADI_2g48950v3 [Brachypodium distachyon]PNT72773.1 hypothetical protein BRADI_2g48950v3 [Brachypodium distachyon]PNT72774.1 hypothetical protein BRADI_2g48950v3 [Brachypodium distachyon]|eukprot:XP_003567080.2 uncharacterized protein LOC100837984 isoform X1 [Brachypodium distachyon]